MGAANQRNCAEFRAETAPAASSLGVAVALIASHRWSVLTLHLDGSVAWTRSHQLGYFVGAIVKGRSALRKKRFSILGNAGCSLKSRYPLRSGELSFPRFRGLPGYAASFPRRQSASASFGLRYSLRECSLLAL